MNFYEQELRKLVDLGIATESDTSYFLGRVCFIPLTGNRRARVEFAGCGNILVLEALNVTILDTTNGPVDRLQLLFEDYFIEQTGDAATRILPTILVCQGVPTWFRTPTREEQTDLAAAARKYIALFA